MMEYDVEPAPLASDDQLARVSTLAERQLEEEREIQRLEGMLKAAKTALSMTRERDLPEAMAAAQTADHTSLAGVRVKLAVEYRCGQLTSEKPDHHPRLAWLTDEGHGDVIKNTIVVRLPLEMEAVADELMALLRTHRLGNQLDVARARMVPWNTLAALARELTDAGADPPLDLLGVARVPLARVSTKEKI